MTSISEIATALQARRSGPGWLARCPAHEDRSPSLSIREQGGKLLVHCFSGCAQSEIIDALKARGLWPEREHSAGRACLPDPNYRVDAERAEYWRHALLLLADEFLECVSATDPDRRSVTALAAAARDDGALVNLYRRQREAAPKFTAALVWAGRRSVARLERKAAFFISGGMRVESQTSSYR